MEWLLLPVLFPFMVGILAIVLTVVSASQREKARRLEMAHRHHWAQQHGLHYTPNDRSIAALSLRAPFCVGSDRVGYDVFRGHHRGRAMVFGEYRYSTKSNDSTVVHPWQFVALALPTPRPALSISRETGGGIFSRRKGLQLESEEFNNRFRIDTASERFAYDVLNPRAMEWLLADVRANTVGFRFEGQWAITVRAGNLRPEEVWFYADFLHDVIALVPDFVWRY